MQRNESDPLTLIRTYLSSRDSALFAVDAEFRFMSQSEPLRGRRAIDTILRMLYDEMFSEVELEASSLLVVGKGVVAELTFYGTNTGPLMGFPPTGKRIAVPMAAIYEVEDSHISRVRLYYDSVSITRQLGLSTVLW
jgi:predicted ester cyclase